MNRKQKIIVSVTGIFLVALILIGLTYAYFLTQITGNTNPKSISISTANLQLRYDDGTNILLDENTKLVPSDEKIGTKIFNVINEGDDASYAVAIENVKVTIAGTEEITTFKTNDFEYELTCTISSNDSSRNDQPCNGQPEGTTLPLNDNILISNEIQEGDTHEYEMTVWYKDNGDDQSDDMNKTLEARVNIIDNKNTITIAGKVDGASNGDRVELIENNNIAYTDGKNEIKLLGNETDNKKISYLYKDSSYRFIGIKPGNYDVLYYKNNGSTPTSTTNINIKLGSEGKVDLVNNQVTITENSSTISLNVNSSEFELVKKIRDEFTGVNPYNNNKNSLTYHIFNNAQTKKNGTELLNTPLTKLGEETSSYYTGEVENRRVATKEDNFNGWSQSMYGDTKDSLAFSGIFISNLGMDNDVEICNLVRRKHIADITGIYIGVVVSCTEDGTPIIGDEKSANEKILSIAQDSYGTSYYYRGFVSDNYVTFANMCWRAVRIDGNDNVKLILEDQDEPCSETMNGNWDIGSGNFGYERKSVVSGGSSTNVNVMNYLNPVNNKEDAMVNAFKNFQINTLSNKISAKYNGKTLSDFLVSGNWCLNTKAYSDESGTTLLETLDYSSDFYYGSFVDEPTLQCPVDTMNTFTDSTTPMYVATLTYDEVTFSGAKSYGFEENFYRYRNDFYLNNANNNSFWLLTPMYFNGQSDHVSFLDYGYTNIFEVNPPIGHSFRPSVSLKSGVEIVSGGIGTQDNPYVVE